MENSLLKLSSLHVFLPEDLKEFVHEEVAEGGYSTPSDFVRTVLRERRAQKLRQRIDAALLESLDTPAEEVTPEYLAQLRREARTLIIRKKARVSRHESMTYDPLGSK
jgi:antitoxin ParD1/3/4